MNRELGVTCFIYERSTEDKKKIKTLIWYAKYTERKYYFDERKDGGGFDHKSALFENHLRKSFQ